MSANEERDISLSHYAGKKVRVICLECDVLKTFEGSDLLSEFGDVSMPGMLDTLHTKAGCEKPKTGYYGRCTMTYYISPAEWVKRGGYVSRDEYEIALGKRLRDLKEWETLEAKCTCGRQGRLNPKSLIRRYGGDARIRDLSRKLICQDCKKYDSVIEITTLPR